MRLLLWLWEQWESSTFHFKCITWNLFTKYFTLLGVFFFFFVFKLGSLSLWFWDVIFKCLQYIQTLMLYLIILRPKHMLDICYFIFFPALLRYNWHLKLYKFKVYNVMICYIYMYQTYIHMYVWLPQYNYLTPPSPHIKITFFVFVRWENLIHILLATFEYIVLLTKFTMFYIRSPDIINLTAD